MSGPHTESPQGPSCTRRGAGATCLHDLAAGWILASDLCPGCTSRFMAALDLANGAPLPWHQNYRDRANGVGR